MARTPFTTLTLGLLALGLGGCVTGDGTTRSEKVARVLSDMRVGERVNNICFTRGIDNFRDETDVSVIVRRGVDDEYLLLMRSCPFLDQAQSLALTSNTSCLRENDGLFVFDSPFGTNTTGIPNTRCFVDEIYRWNEPGSDVADEMAGDGT